LDIVGNNIHTTFEFLSIGPNKIIFLFSYPWYTEGNDKVMPNLSVQYSFFLLSDLKALEDFLDFNP